MPKKKEKFERASILRDVLEAKALEIKDGSFTGSNDEMIEILKLLSEIDKQDKELLDRELERQSKERIEKEKADTERGKANLVAQLEREKVQANAVMSQYNARMDLFGNLGSSLLQGFGPFSNGILNIASVGMQLNSQEKRHQDMLEVVGKEIEGGFICTSKTGQSMLNTSFSGLKGLIK